jgi:hypothetical protein
MYNSHSCMLSLDRNGSIESPGLVAGALGSYGNRDGKRLVKKMVSDRHLPPHCGFLCLEV